MMKQNSKMRLNTCIAFSALMIGMSAAFADDALVLPEGVFRFIAGTSHRSINQEYGKDGTKTDLGVVLGTKVKGVTDMMALGLTPTSKVEVSVLREDFAMEYGWNETTSLSLQLPAYISANQKVIQNSDMASALTALNNPLSPTSGKGKYGELFSKLSQDGKKAGTFGDMLLGVKHQFLHSAASPVAVEGGTYRLAGALGVKIPTGSIASPDTNNVSTTTASDTQSWILGARTYFDYQFTSFFYANFYSEHEYRLAGTKKNLSTNNATLSYQVVDTKYKPGVFNHLELDLVLTPSITEKFLSESGVRLSADFTGVGKYTEAPEAQASLLSGRDAASKSYTLSPYIGVFYTGAPFPMKFKVISTMATGGENSKVVNGYTGVMYAYMKF